MNPELNLPVVASEISPSKMVRALILIPVLLTSALFLAPLGFIVIFKLKSFELAVLYWFVYLVMFVSAFYVNRFQFWIIFSFLSAFTFFNAIGTSKFGESLSGMH